LDLDNLQILANGFDEESATNGVKKVLESINVEFSCISKLWNHIKYTQDKFVLIYANT
jgi:hypothetical protein